MNSFQRCWNALNWKNIDRVLVVLQNSDMSISLSGYSMKECLYDPKSW